MHFSIPDTEELSEGNGSTYTGYNIHINGVFHCTVRYKQLHYLNEQLKKEFGNDNVPSFPPKKILPLTSSQLTERRSLLEKYIQSVGQDTKLMSSELVRGFLLSAQLESACSKQKDVYLDIYLMNNCQIKVRVCISDCAKKVLIKALQQVNLPVEYMQYFSLFLVKSDTRSNNDFIVLRKLLDFESPFLTQQVIRTATRIVIRKSYWDPIYDKELLTDPVALNLLYIQIVNDIERGWIITMRESRTQLEKFKNRLAKREYIEYAQKLKYYGFLQFAQCTCDYPQPQTKVLVSIGDEELCLRILGPANLVKEGVFKVTRMRCWRITATNNKKNITDNGELSNGIPPSNLELSFEYLMSKEKLQWITICSDQAILMSVCLQSLVDELLMKKCGTNNKSNHKAQTKWSYMKRDGSSHLICSLDDDLLEDREGSDEEPFSIRSLQEKFSSVSFKNGREYIENHAFEGIGDDDL